MNILITYATNTGNTYLVAQIVRDMLKPDHDINFKPIADTTKEDISSSDLILMGSSSWDWEGNEGHPIHSMMNFLQSLEDHDIKDKKFVLFGCGDTDFQHFCGAIDVMEKHITEHGGQIIHEPLRVDKFYIDIMNKVEFVKTWAQGLSASLK